VAEFTEIPTPALPLPEENAVRIRPVLFAALSLIIIFFLYQVVGGGLTLLIFGSSITAGNVQWMRAATMIAQILFLLVPTLFLIRYQHGSFRRAFSWRFPKASEVILAIVAVFSLQQVMEGYLFFQDMIPLPESIRPFVEMMKRLIEETYQQLVEAHSPGELMFVLLVVSLTPAVCEELLFRGLIQKNLVLGTGKTAGYVATGIIFGLYHVNPFLVVPLVSLGILFSFFMSRSGTILVPIAAHFTNNVVSTFGVYFGGRPESSEALKMFNSLSDYSAQFVLSSTLGFGLIFAVSLYFYHQVTSRQRVEPEGGVG